MKTSELNMAEWWCQTHPDGGKEFDGEHWICSTCGEPLEEFPVKAYRVTTDEPQGICVGFKPALTQCDKFELVEYDYPCETELYIFISLDGKKMAISMDDNYGHRKAQYPDWPAEHEPEDMMIWHTPDEFDAWAEEVGFKG